MKRTISFLFSLLILTAQAQDGKQTYTGKGVNMVVIDGGFDLLHPAFTDEQGNTRIKALFVYGGESGKKVTVTDPEKGEVELFGCEYTTPEEFTELETDSRMAFHGTHTTGIAAGRMSPQGIVGQAPEADIYLISTVPPEGKEITDKSEATLLRNCVYYILNRIANNGQPTVVNYSMGNIAGPHNSTGPIYELSKQLAQNGVIFCAATGNSGDGGHYIYKKFIGDDDAIRTFLAYDAYDLNTRVLAYTREGQDIAMQVVIYDTTSKKEVWTSSPVSLTGPSRELTDDDEAALEDYLDGTLTLTASEWENGCAEIGLQCEGDLINESHRLAILVKGGENSEIDVWGDQSMIDLNVEGYVKGQSDINCTEMSSSPYVVSVGNYNNDGLAPLDGDISSSSSYGNSLTGTLVPTICAPGENILSSMNLYCESTYSENISWDGHPYGRSNGTSMACPYVAGTIATWLEANPNLTIDDVLHVLEETAYKDHYVTESPARFGGGKLDVEKALEYVLTTSGISHAAELTVSEDNAWYTLSGQKLYAKPTRKGIYIHSGHKIVIN